MTLRFEMENNIISELPSGREETNWRNRNQVNAKDGFIIAILDEKRIATFKTLYTESIVHRKHDVS